MFAFCVRLLILIVFLIFFFFFFMYESQNTPLLIYVLKAFINVIYCLMAFVWCFFHPMKMRNRFDFFMESFFVFF